MPSFRRKLITAAYSVRRKRRSVSTLAMAPLSRKVAVEWSIIVMKAAAGLRSEKLAQLAICPTRVKLILIRGSNLQIP